MPNYKPLRTLSSSERKRTIQHLKLLREQLNTTVPGKTATETLLLATWNIREFQSGNRLAETFHYIAEIVSRFDLVAIQEVGRDLTALQQLLYLLGPNYSYIVTDSTEGSAGGMERIAFVYDRYKVRFMNIAGEIVLPEKKLISGKQFARTPFCVAFQAGWFKFMLTSVHIYFGKETGVEKKRRVDEIAAISTFLSARAKKENTNYILLGDFNIPNTSDPTFLALEEGGFHVPEAILKEASLGTNKEQSKIYDQIAFKLSERKDMTLFKEGEENNAGVFDYYTSVFREDAYKTYKRYFPAAQQVKDAAAQEKYYLNTWRTFQMSDHLPRWVKLRIDFSDEYLSGLLEPGA